MSGGWRRGRQILTTGPIFQKTNKKNKNREEIGNIKAKFTKIFKEKKMLSEKKCGLGVPVADGEGAGGQPPTSGGGGSKGA